MPGITPIGPTPTPVYFKLIVNEGDTDETIMYAEECSAPEIDKMLYLWRNSVPQGRFVIERVEGMTAKTFAAMPLENGEIVPGTVTRITSVARTTSKV